MKDNYKLYGDILIVDATYRVNKYSLPLVIFSGFNYSGRNCLFGVAIVNNETESTYEWVFKKFFETQFQKYPRILITDQDLSMIIKGYKDLIEHYLHCSWHFCKKLKKN